MPTLSEFLTRVRSKSLTDLIRLAPQHAWTVLNRRAIAAYYWNDLHVTPFARTRRRHDAVQQLRSSQEVLFLCHGNICRSPFAERYARKELSSRGINTLNVSSAGFVDMNNPRSPRNAQSAAEAFDIDLTDHRSVKATDAIIEAADLIFLMDYRNYHNFTTHFPQAIDRMFLLRIFEPGSTMQLPDPNGNSSSVFDTVYADIAACIRSLIDEYESVISKDLT
ncbi:arsenate reductase/protein-tyrosine-phosphatase family protein [Halobellus limi]|uniref:arsenate reductase/protein-tyrosine-phosphatase family protein n=1 Tax=Halobellus limi TaxID=699433 RepID=UPI001F1E90A7|nr:hypothetical protein [Halobellus limi]